MKFTKTFERHFYGGRIRELVMRDENGTKITVINGSRRHFEDPRPPWCNIKFASKEDLIRCTSDYETGIDFAYETEIIVGERRLILIRVCVKGDPVIMSTCFLSLTNWRQRYSNPQVENAPCIT